jgi:hypothetical protein
MDAAAEDPARSSLAASRFVEAIMSAAAELGDAVVSPQVLVPPGAPVRSGRLHVGRLRSRLPVDGPVRVLVGFGSVCWLGGPHDVPPGLGRMVFRAEAPIDRRGRVVLDRRARAWLAVEDPAAFEAVVMPAPAGGVLVVPVEGFAGRAEAVEL